LLLLESVAQYTHICRSLSLHICSFGAELNAASAQYLYFENAPAAHRQLVKDLREWHPDMTNLDPRAAFYLQQLENLLARLPSNEIRVCQTLQVQYPNGTEFSFRTHHGSAMLDWVVNVSRSPQVIMSITAWPMPPQADNYAPAILPLYTPGTAQTLTPPTTLGCPSGSLRPASDTERLRACKRWPKMCE
jgi:hypothetical protein